MIEIKSPYYVHREFANDLGRITQENEHSWMMNTSKRVALVALPFASLYKPYSFPLSVATGGLRIFHSLTELHARIGQNNFKGISYEFLQTTLSIISVAGTIFAHPLGMLITTGHDLFAEAVHLIQCVQSREYEKAMESSIKIVNHILYGSLFLYGGLELTIASLAIQTLLCAYLSQKEFRQGHQLEATAHILMAIIRIQQTAQEWQCCPTLKKKLRFRRSGKKKWRNNGDLSGSDMNAGRKICSHT